MSEIVCEGCGAVTAGYDTVPALNQSSYPTATE
jgi:hypothetical protein